MVAVASGYPQLSLFGLGGCDNITDATVVTIGAFQCKQLTTLDLKITDAEVITVLAQLTRLNMSCCCTLTDEAVVAGGSGRPGPHPKSKEDILIGCVLCCGL